MIHMYLLASVFFYSIKYYKIGKLGVGRRCHWQKSLLGWQFLHSLILNKPVCFTSVTPYLYLCFIKKIIKTQPIART